MNKWKLRTKFLQKISSNQYRKVRGSVNSCKELTHWKRLWCWEGLGAGGEGDDRGWDGWMASWTRWTWVWVNSGSWWCRGRPGVLWFMGLQRVGHDWATELNWTEKQYNINIYVCVYILGWFYYIAINSLSERLSNLHLKECRMRINNYFTVEKSRRLHLNQGIKVNALYPR